MDDNYDFGFTAVDESELNDLLSAPTHAEIDHLNETINMLHSAILPLLNNLKKNPDKDYIHWKGDERIKNIEAFEQKLQDIMNRSMHGGSES